MYGRRLLALAVSLIIGLPEVSMATLLRDDSNNLPSSFAVNLTRPDLNHTRLENRALLGLTDKVNIFSQYKFPGVSFESAASEGLSVARAEQNSRSLEELIVAASLGEGIYGSEDGPRETETRIASLAEQHMAPPDTGPTLRDVATNLVNRPASGGHRPPLRKPVSRAGGFSLVDFVLGTQIDDAFIDIATNVVTPVIEPDGIISLNLMGLRDFAFLISPVTSKIQVLDFKTGLTITVSPSAYRDSSDNAGQLGQHQRGRSINEESLAFYMLLKILNKIDYFVHHVLLHPVTIVVLLLLCTCCGAMSIVRRAH